MNETGPQFVSPFDWKAAIKKMNALALIRLMMGPDRLHVEAYHEIILRSDKELCALRMATPPPPHENENWVEARATANAYLEEETVSQSRVPGGGK